MKLKTTLFGNVYQFKDVKEVLAKANELRSGDVLAGVAAASSQERVAAKQVLSEMTVADIRNNPVIAYEDDCVTRLIQDDVNETAYNQIKNWSISELREYVLSDETSVDDIAFTRKGLTSEVVAAVAKICSNADLIYGAKKMPVIKKANTTIGIPGTFSARLQPNDTRDDVQSIAAQIYEGLSFGVGDAVIGVNPVPENLKLTPKVEVDNVHQRQTTDVYEHALTITAWQQIYDQLHPGKFHGEFTEILLDDIQVFREYTGLALRQSCLVWPNSFWFGIPATRGEQGFIGSQCLGSAEIATRPGGTEFELSTPDDYTILGVVLSEDVITRQANFLHNPDRVLHMLRNQSALEVKEQHKAALWGFVQQALATFCENPENLHQPAVRKVLGDNLLMAMGAMLEEAQPMVTAESISHQSYRRLLSRAREYVLENMSEPVTVLDLCNQLHVSRRTLQNAFHAILGIGPNAWLKRIRLNAVRRELISPWSQSMTVKDAAMQWGFWHLGQFATDYQQLFAEKPSLTLHQRMREWG
ncbi:HTH-type transcriptional regulator EutR [Escherichia coli]|nr:HTH-type transcriptional regulator EutR [Escherichia coli]